MTRTAAIVSGVATIVMTVAVGGLSRVPYRAQSGDDAVIRLAWRTRGVRVDECRRLSPDELAELPVHMRREEVCESRTLPFRLRLEVDGVTVIDKQIESGGRQDRPLFVFEEVAVAPGAVEVSVSFVREAEIPTGASEVEFAPARLELRERLELDARSVALVTYDPQSRRLILRGAGS
jgi:hypothetical protein